MRKRIRTITHKNVEMLRVEFRGCVFWVPTWTQYLAREKGKRVLALDCYPVWDDDLKELRSKLLEPRTRENTRYWYVGLDGGAILREGTELIHISHLVVKRKDKLTLSEGGQELVSELNSKPIWDRD